MIELDHKAMSQLVVNNFEIWFVIMVRLFRDASSSTTELIRGLSKLLITLLIVESDRPQYRDQPIVCSTDPVKAVF